MRRAGLRAVASWALLAIGVPGAIVACGQQHAGAGAAGSPTAAVRTTPEASAATPTAGGHGCGGAVPVSATHGSVTLSGSDNGKSLCVAEGTVVRVYLHGTAADRWAPIRASSDDLIPHPDTSFMLPLGVTGASYKAVHPGTVTLTSSRPDCGQAPQPAPTGPSTSTASHCHSLTGYRVSLVITG